MANVKLSAAEIELVTNADFILTKNNIITKVYMLLGELSVFYVDEINKRKTLPHEVVAITPKISRGENYEGLPWVMLDYPRYFTATDVLAIRTYFWWGNFFSITLQLKGKYQIKNFKSKISDWYLCCNADEWQHHFRADNYKPLNDFSDEEIEALSFIKLAKKIPLTQWDDIEILIRNDFITILNILEK